EHPDRRGHHLHRPGHHGTRGRQPDPGVPRLRRRRQGRRRRDTRPPRPRGPRGAGVRLGRPGGRAPRRAHQGLRRHRPAGVHQGRRLRGDRERHRADRDRHGAHPARRRRADGRARRRARRPHHRAQLPRDHRPRRHQDGRHRRPGARRGQGLLPGTRRRHLPLGRHDDRDVLDAHGGRPRPVDRGLDRRRRDHRPGLRGAHAALRGRRADGGHRHLHRAGRPHGGPARRVGDRQRLAPAGRRLHGRPLHGRDAGDVLRARRHDRRGQGGHRHGEDRAPGRGRDRGRRGDLADPRHRQVEDRGAQGSVCL
ncbi:MAG: Succinyl-CoA ligase [ADP-forming] alpha chain, partial [uncultured Solirubrobacteraceae bacterium]